MSETTKTEPVCPVCPQCREPAMKAIYFGFPLGVCESETCAGLVWGPGSYVMLVFFNGWLMLYRGSYWRALWTWLFARRESE